MIETLKHIDTTWFLAINNGMQNAFLDIVCPFMRNQKTWYLLYALLFVISYKKWKKKSLWILGGAVLLILLADQISANLIKNTVQRLRPCNEPSLAGMVNNIVGCGKGYSFISAHATNHFAIAVFFSMIFYREYKWVFYVAIFWAALIAFSQVYVGVHYPFDVICGAILGSTLGYFGGKFIYTKLNVLIES
jgi:membrane-associated phospholipid phosphatase